MQTEIASSKSGRRLHVSVILKSALVFLSLMMMGTIIARNVVASRSMVGFESPVTTSYDDCIDGCPPDYHCNMQMNIPNKRACEPNTVIPGTLEVVMADGTKKTGEPMSKDELGCPISSYGKYSKGKDGKCHWMPDNSSLEGRDKWHCNNGFEKVRVSTLTRMPKGKNIDYKCVLRLK